jgi:lysine 6-dehydrogenase
MSDIIVLGAGMVGSAMAIDLSTQHAVTLTDVNPKVLDAIKQKNHQLQYQVLDVTDSSLLVNTITPFDLVICAVPGFLGYQTMYEIINAGKNVVDISFFPERALDLDALAKEKNVTAIVDCGVAPGMGNYILGRYNRLMTLDKFECLVGGLPKIKKWPFEYKAPFSPVDVIEEYTRPARFVENHHLVIREALSDCELIHFDTVGTLEAFNSDGLRSIIETMPHIPHMKEKTLRYPGHVEYIKVLKESGFFETEKMTIGNTSISPLEFTSRILFKEWKLESHEPELTVMRILLEGKNKDGKQERIVYELYDEFDPKTGISSMARTTGYTATGTANMLLEGLFTEKGVFPPELIGHHESCFQYVMNYLQNRNVQYRKTVINL